MQAQFTVQNQLGIHARPARKIVQTAAAFPCDIYLEKDGKRVGAKSLVNVLTLGAKYGNVITIIAEGEREEEAVREIGAIIESPIEKVEWK
ncbi:HPr family phosphocarrier protein [Paenibacillus thermoaerophilus]|uniref:HPr family phosphocarrier protein n=1 Tax=Paenibacillus thermoaerophilus TaxID=1215385 RepID=A0ABW2UY40_9BACL|nr:HPr family phosphocarrier protein [Paenibacillus thermoaerophilus]TMV19166.1 HPr family phosphocarrier protein [Paenibacillus thermoaerophilus]